MPGKLGTCPTCKKEWDKRFKYCPNCLETVYWKTVPDEKHAVVRCERCGGTGGESRQCPACNGSGAMTGVKNIDLRTGELLSDACAGSPTSRPSSWPSISASPIPSSGCAIMAAAILSAAGMIVMALIL